VNCDELKTQLESYLDGELTLSDKRDVEEHLNDCTGCTQAFDALRFVQTQVRESDYKKVPASLKLNIQNQLRDVTGEQTRRAGWFTWLGVGGGGMAAGALATWAIMSFVLFSPLHNQFADSIIESHISALMVDHATDVKTSDSHTVKPWFNGRVDFSPPVKDLHAEGFELLGGRLDYLQGKTVSALVYKRRAHIINAFVFKSEDATSLTTPTLMQRHGYNLVYWSKDGLEFWLVSDLNKKEISQLAQLFIKT